MQAHRLVSNFSLTTEIHGVLFFVEMRLCKFSYKRAGLRDAAHVGATGPDPFRNIRTDVNGLLSIHVEAAGLRRQSRRVCRRHRDLRFRFWFQKRDGDNSAHQRDDSADKEAVVVPIRNRDGALDGAAHDVWRNNTRRGADSTVDCQDCATS